MTFIMIRNTYKKIDILELHSINAPNRVYLKAVSHVTQGTHLADRVEISKFDVFRWVLYLFNTGGVSERDFEIGRALYIRSLQLQP